MDTIEAKQKLREVMDVFSMADIINMLIELCTEYGYETGNHYYLMVRNKLQRTFDL